MKKTVYTFGADDFYTGPFELGDDYLVPFTTNRWTLPYNSVEFAPPAVGPREIAKINADRTAWIVVPYWKGHVYWLADRSKHTITEAGIAPPAGWLAADPGPGLADVQADQIALINASCEAAIVAGFESAALGQTYLYPCKLTDQANLQASVSVAREVADTVPEWRAPFWCQDPVTGQWSYQLHTAEQIRQVGMDGYTATLSKLQRKGLLEAQIQQAATIQAVKAITW